MSGTNLFAPEATSAVKISLTDEFGNAILVKCATGDIPSAAAGYAIGCLLIDTTTGQSHYNIGTASSCTFNKATGQYYVNDTSKTATTLKIHNHLTTASIGSYEGKTETVTSSGAFYGLWQDANANVSGTESITAILGVATVAATYTVTGGTIIGTYGQARADGTMAGSGFMAGLYGLIEEGGGAITASHVCSAWLDSHRNTAVTGSHQLLYMTNNGSATLDEAIYIYGGDKTTAFVEFNTCSGMVSDTATTSGTSKKIKITVDGTVYYINAYTG